MSTELVRQEPTTMQMIQQVLQTGGDPVQMATVVKELVALRQSEERFAWEREERQARIDFDEALSRCQKSIGRIAPNVSRKDTSSWWADYAQLDRTIRPIYTQEGFAISFSEVEPISAGKVRIKGTASRSGISKEFFSEITPSTTGAKGNALVNATDADAIAQSRAKRYILIDIFNIAVGIDREEKKGIAPSEILPTEEQEVKLQEWKDALRQCDTKAQLQGVFADAYKYAASVNPQAKSDMTRVYNECKEKLA